MKQSTIERRFEEFLRQHSLKLTTQRKRIFDRTFATHEHFSAEKLYGWLRSEDGARVSRATIYRTLDLLVKGGFLGALDTGQGELVYEHVLAADGDRFDYELPRSESMQSCWIPWRVEARIRSAGAKPIATVYSPTHGFETLRASDSEVRLRLGLEAAREPGPIQFSFLLQGDGINAWLRVADERDAIVKLAAAGIRVAPGAPFQIGDASQPHVRVTVGVLRDEAPLVGAALAAVAAPA